MPYAFSFFKTSSEKLFLAYSIDGLSWINLNDGRPILESQIKTRSMRDPYIRKGPDGKFHLLWTDGWHSQFIGYTSSEDLIHWGEQRAIPVMLPFENAQNSWAPEFVYDPDSKLYWIFWSSTITPIKKRFILKDKIQRDHRIWYCTTSDFREFSSSKVFFDPGYNVIDATLAQCNNSWYMAFKDERGRNTPFTSYKAIKIAVCDLPLETLNWKIISNDYITPPLTEGPSFFQRNDMWYLIFDHFASRKYGAVKSRDFRTWGDATAEIDFPPGARHGSIFEISQETLYSILRSFA